MKKYVSGLLALLLVPVLGLAQTRELNPTRLADLQSEQTFTLVEGAGGEGALSKTVDGSMYESLQIVATAATTDRSLQVSCMALNGTTSLFDFPAITVTAGAVATMVVMRADGRQVPGFIPAWAASTAYRVGERVTNSSNVYEVITAGTSAAAGGPTTTAADITDNTAHWKFIAVAGVAAPTGVTYLDVSPCNKVRASMAAVSAGPAVNAFLGVYGRARPGFVRPISSFYESGSVASGAALSRTVNATRLESIQVLVEATTTNRALVASCMAANGTTTLFSFPSHTITQGQKYLLTYRFDSAVPLGEVTNVKHVPVEVCPIMKFAIAATGAASAKLAVYGR